MAIDLSSLFAAEFSRRENARKEKERQIARRDQNIRDTLHVLITTINQQSASLQARGVSLSINDDTKSIELRGSTPRGHAILVSIPLNFTDDAKYVQLRDNKIPSTNYDGILERQ